MAGTVVLHQESFLPPLEDLTMAGDIFGSNGIRGNVAFSGERTVMLLNILQYGQDMPNNKELPSPKYQ